MSEWNEAVESRGGYISTKQGCDVILKNIKVTKNTNPMYQPKKSDVKNPDGTITAGELQGYSWEINSGSDKVGVTTYSLQKALFASGCKDGDTINIKHPGKGEYIVTVVAKGSETVSEEAPFQQF